MQLSIFTLPHPIIPPTAYFPVAVIFVILEFVIVATFPGTASAIIPPTIPFVELLSIVSPLILILSSYLLAFEKPTIPPTCALDSVSFSVSFSVTVNVTPFNVILFNMSAESTLFPCA